MQIGRISPNLKHSEVMSQANDGGKKGFASAAKPADVESPKKAAAAAARKKSKKPKDMPKRPLSAYNIFFQIERKKLMEAREKGETPDDFDVASVSSTSDGDEQDKRKRASLFQAIAQTIANRWKSLPSDERVKFEELAKEEMRKYRIKKDEYQQRMVRETLDGSSGRSSSAAGSPAVAPARDPTASLSGTMRGAPPTSAAALTHHGLFSTPGGHTTVAAPAVTIFMPQSYTIQDYLQRQGFQSAAGQFAGAGFPQQDARFPSMPLQGLGGGAGLDRLLTIRALQNDPSIRRIDPAFLPQAGVTSYLGLPGAGGLDPRLTESFRFQEGTGAGLGGAAGAPAGFGNLDLLGRLAHPQLQLSDLPPEQLLRYLNTRQGGGGGGGGGAPPRQPPGGYPGL